MNKIEIWFFEKINEIHKPVAKPSKIKRGALNDQYEEGKKMSLQTLQTFFKKAVRKYYELLYTHKFYNLNKMD